MRSCSNIAEHAGQRPFVTAWIKDSHLQAPLQPQKLPQTWLRLAKLPAQTPCAPRAMQDQAQPGRTGSGHMQLRQHWGQKAMLQASGAAQEDTNAACACNEVTALLVELPVRLPCSERAFLSKAASKKAGSSLCPFLLGLLHGCSPDNLDSGMHLHKFVGAHA